MFWPERFKELVLFRGHFDFVNDIIHWLFFQSFVQTNIDWGIVGTERAKI